jgi:glyoxylase-like metal-dependent hydrolase (beta-lactamase superfamily II)
MDEISIEIKQDMPGFDHFFGAWVIKGGVNIVVDVGPANSALRLLESLGSLGMDRLNYILLTHIHIDHCGGLAQVLDYFPMAKVICHEKTLKYLIDPSKLWEGSTAVLGEIAKAYGRPEPIEEDRLIPHTESDLEDLVVIETPGHSAHHLSFSYRNRLFVGEAAGNYLVLEDREYLRPATPPRFFFDVCMKSVDKLLALDDQPIRYAHFDSAKRSHRLLRIFREQLMHWKEIICEQMRIGEVDLVNRCIHALLEKDPNLEALQTMDPDTQRRERFFMTNSVKGFIGFFKARP